MITADHAHDFGVNDPDRLQAERMNSRRLDATIRAGNIAYPVVEGGGAAETNDMHRDRRQEMIRDGAAVLRAAEQIIEDELASEPGLQDRFERGETTTVKGETI